MSTLKLLLIFQIALKNCLCASITSSNGTPDRVETARISQYIVIDHCTILCSILHCAIELCLHQGVDYRPFEFDLSFCFSHVEFIQDMKKCLGPIIVYYMNNMKVTQYVFISTVQHEIRIISLCVFVLNQRIIILCIL